MPEAILSAALALLLLAAASHRFRRDSGATTPARIRALRIAAVVSLVLSWSLCGGTLTGERFVRFVVSISIAAIPVVLALSIAANTIMRPLNRLLARRIN